MSKKKGYQLPLFVKEEVERDGTALANQVADSQLSVVMYLIALASMSYAVWTMVQMRRIKRGDEVDESDQTAEVIENMASKSIPDIAPMPQQMPQVTHAQPSQPVAQAARHKCQHQHLLCHQLDCLKVGLWSNGHITVISTCRIRNDTWRKPHEWRRFNGNFTREISESC